MDIEKFENQTGLHFKDKRLLEMVFTHRSYLNEAGTTDLEHNERLEFLGDAVLELAVTDYLYKNFTNPEGELTNWRSSIVRGEILARVAGELELGEFLFLSRGEDKSGGRTRTLILANTFEALIGAIYLDAGYKDAEKFISHHLIALLPEIIEKKLYIDPKSRLQELSQEKLGSTPEYRVVGEEGPDHTKVFTVGVYVSKKLLAQGTGSSKQKAETAAASEAIKEFN
ncbi:MAG: Ribonuclease 3 [Berkelbacteria bacterium GW2011_GWA2_46_7]|uniref:Ribonuclease 3 n=1 Tax=Berkelbacteria bacterium GW2011_GWA2_46_7 TaxID=1618335 RepID=A0A0G1QF10_9BACT|nr:MAG: Ribonuclease 3 [Berkelbacteria bacterium GW2011_GWA2_46_7]